MPQRDSSRIDVRASSRDDPSGPSDSRPRRGVEPSAAARPARRRERREPVPIGAALSIPVSAGQKGAHPGRSDRHDVCMEAEVCICASIKPQRREAASPRSSLRPSAGERDRMPDRSSVVTTVIGPIDDSTDGSPARDWHCVTTSSPGHVTRLRPWRRSGP